MTSARELSWISTLTVAATTLADQADHPRPTDVRSAFWLLWVTAGAVEAADATGELWWLRRAETVKAVASAQLPTVPRLGLNLGAAYPAGPLPDSPLVRGAMTTLLTMSRQSLGIHARDTETAHAWRVWSALRTTWDTPMSILSHEDALDVVYSRAQLYRTASSLTELYVNATTAAGLPADPEVLRLQADLAATVDRTRGMLGHPSPTSGQSITARSLRNAAAHAVDAWETCVIDPVAIIWLDGDDTAGWLADAATLVAVLAGLDTRWEAALWAVAHDPMTPADAARALRETVVDCTAVRGLGLQQYVHALATPADPAPLPTRSPPRQLATDEAVAAVDSYATSLAGRGNRLVLPDDIADLSRVAARLAAVVVPYVTADPATAHDAVSAWRRCYHSAVLLRSNAPLPAAFGQSYRIAEWADRQLTDQAFASSAALPAHAYEAIARSLPNLAQTAHSAILAMHANQSLQSGGIERAEPSPIPDRNRLEADLGTRAHVSGQALPDRAADIAAAFDTAKAASEQLAGAAGHQPRPSRAEQSTDRIHAHRADRAVPPGQLRSAAAAFLWRADIEWRNWQIRAAAADSPQVFHAVPTPGVRPAPPRRLPEELEQHLRSAVGDGFTEIISDDPALPALEAALQDAAVQGQDITGVLAIALNQRLLNANPSPASVLAGRIRRIAIDVTLPLRLPSHRPGGPDHEPVADTVAVFRRRIATRDAAAAPRGNGWTSREHAPPSRHEPPGCDLDPS